MIILRTICFCLDQTDEGLKEQPTAPVYNMHNVYPVSSHVTSKLRQHLFITHIDNSIYSYLVCIFIITFGMTNPFYLNIFLFVNTKCFYMYYNNSQVKIRIFSLCTCQMAEQALVF